MPKLLRFVAWFQIGAGLLTAAYGGFVLLQGSAARGAVVFGGALIVLGLGSCFFGAALRKASKLGWRGSVVLQVLQVPALSFGSLVYRLGLGAFVMLGVELPQLSEHGGKASLLFNFGLGSDFAFFFGRQVEEQYFGINVVALVLLVGLLSQRLRKVQPRQVAP